MTLEASSNNKKITEIRHIKQRKKQEYLLFRRHGALIDYHAVLFTLISL